RYPYEVRKAEDYFCDLPDLTIAPDMLTLAEHILDSKASEFDPATFRDRYEEALLAHLKAKQAGAVPERRKTLAPPHRVVNLMEALRRSVAEDIKGAAPRKGASAPRARNGAGSPSPPAPQCCRCPTAGPALCIWCGTPCGWGPPPPPAAGGATPPRTPHARRVLGGGAGA